MLHEFYAVTITSVYLVKDKGDDGFPSAEKIALRGKSSFPVGYKLQGGIMIAICKGLQMYIPEGCGLTTPMFKSERRIEGVTKRWWGERSSPIVALFKDRDEALKCSECGDLQPCDSRWLEQTKAVLNEIGNDHPAFYIATMPGFALPISNRRTFS